MLSHNAYFEDNVQSVAFERHGRKTSVGAIAPGSYHFGTEAAERMSVISGECQVQRDGSDAVITYAAGTAFEVAANSGFTISCNEAVAYMCEYLQHPFVKNYYLTEARRHGKRHSENICFCFSTLSQRMRIFWYSFHIQKTAIQNNLLLIVNITPSQTIILREETVP